jgi:hypothetical protein
MSIIARFYAAPQTIQRESNFVKKCNLVKHKLIVTSYMSGDDRDHWSLQCSDCLKMFRMSDGGWEPDLNYCPYCSPKSELIGLHSDDSDDEYYSEYDDAKSESAIDHKIKSQNKRYIYINPFCSEEFKFLVRLHATDTPAYDKNNKNKKKYSKDI